MVAQKHHSRTAWWRKAAHLIADRNRETQQEKGIKDKIDPSRACPSVTSFLQLGPTSIQL
jgi:hypothetical protein